MTEHVFSGMLKWARVYPHQKNKWDKLSINLYPEDKATRDAIKALGLRSPLKEDDDGFFYTFTRKAVDPYLPGDVLVIGPDGKEMKEPIGNGSKGNVTVQMYQWPDKGFGSGQGAKIVKVEVTELVPYVRPSEGTSVDKPF